MDRVNSDAAGQTGEAPSPVSPDMTYTESSPYAIDDSKRILLPSHWRAPGTPRQFIVMVAGGDKYLSVMPPAAYEKFVTRLREKKPDNVSIPDLERELNSRVKWVTLDRFGRLPLPPEFLTRVGIAKQGFLAGRNSHFEVWQIEKSKDEALTSSRKAAGAAIDSQLLAQ